MKIMLRALAALLLLTAAGSLAANYEANRDYTVLDQPQRTQSSEGVEVREFFSYLCPHCYTFSAPLQDWLDRVDPETVNHVRTPVLFDRSLRPFAQAYYAAETLGIVDDVHMRIFAAVHNQGRRFRSVEDIADFLAEHGVDRERFLNTATGFAVDSRVRQGEQAMRNYRINSTPTVVVAGKYVVNPRTAGSHERMVRIIDYLVKQEAAANGN